MASELSSVQSIHDFTVKDGKGNDVELSKYKGKVLLIVNVASQWNVLQFWRVKCLKLFERRESSVLNFQFFQIDEIL
ncbi:putative phospholipid hydroperoxide glutathione peroxidase isoform X2 [Apium graveolens]|uniref:putative phospholipid hydroperoxide glutathione peroxidase isoform X2 n=1 Tax=Apium graveolens TaxID=4045 RepID=UPI003D7B9A6D